MLEASESWRAKRCPLFGQSFAFSVDIDKFLILLGDMIEITGNMTPKYILQIAFSEVILKFMDQREKETDGSDSLERLNAIEKQNEKSMRQMSNLQQSFEDNDSSSVQ